MVRFNLFLDDQEASSEMGYNRASLSIFFGVSPGKHTLYSKAANLAELPIEVQAGEPVLIKPEVNMGFIMAHNNLVRLEVQKSEVKGVNALFWSSFCRSQIWREKWRCCRRRRIS